MRVHWLFSALAFCICFASGPSVLGEVKLLTPSGYLPGIPFLARVEVRNSVGARDWDLWDAEATLSTDQPNVVLSTNRVALKNGVGTALLSISGTGGFNLRAQVNGELAARAVRDRSAESISHVHGLLAGASSSWTGIVRVTGIVTIPAEHTLTIQPDTLVLLDGTASGTAGIGLVVRGAVQSLGTESAPVVMTCADANLNWGQIRHENAGPSTYQHTFVSRSGRAPGEGHTGTAPTFRAANSTIDFRDSVISDLLAGGTAIGKVMMATGSTISFRDCVFARARMGPEIASTGLLFTNNYVMEMRGPDDSDGLYMHSSNGRSLLVSSSVFAGGDDDGIDTLDAVATIENCILRDWSNPGEDAKGVSSFNGDVTVRHTLVANCFAGISTKSSGPLAVLRLDHCTVSALDRGVAAAIKDNAPDGNINIFMTNSIVLGADAVVSDFGPEKFVSVTYCAFPEPWPGTGNIQANPLFINPINGDFRLQLGSPCIDAGDPASPLDPNGSRTDIGFSTGLAQSGFYVNVTAPAAGSIILGPTNISLNASAALSTGAISRVEFHEGNRKLGDALSAPYSYEWQNVGGGDYTIRAVAVAQSGLTTTSPPVSIKVILAREQPATNVLVRAGSEWKFLDIGVEPPGTWRDFGFDEVNWKTGLAELGYGDGDEVTVIGFGPDSRNKYPTTYFRKTFAVEDASRVESLLLNVLRDDGAIVYVNGQETYRGDMPPGPVNSQTYATSASEYDWELVPISPTLLRTGTNQLAVEVHQGNGSSSDFSFDLELTAVIAAPTNSRPILFFTSPSQGLNIPAPGTLSLRVTATDPDGTVTNVTFLVNDLELGRDGSEPFEWSWSSIPIGQYTLVALATDNYGLTATSAPVALTVSADRSTPAITSYSPPSGSVTNLREVRVSFSKDVVGVDRADLLLNDAPATDVTGSGSNYAFALPPQSAGMIRVSWSAASGITDTLTPANGFDAAGTNATWTYQNFDTTRPILASMSPSPGRTVHALSSVTIHFNEAITHLDAADLLINSAPALSVIGSGAGPYTFNFTQPGRGTVRLEWAANHGITDIGGNPFTGGASEIVLDPTQLPVVINEIMYHPASENPLEEYVELFNAGTAPVNLAGWKFTDGIEFVFPEIFIPAGGYLVVAADLTAFQAKYPNVANVIGNWAGMLSNSREAIELEDALGNRIDSVPYADEGDWAVRQRGLLDRNHRGWVWNAPHDGAGPSVELINPTASNATGQNWGASFFVDGSPGRINSVMASNTAPHVLNMAHLPLVPKSTDPVVVSARVVDETDLQPIVELNYRLDGAIPAAFTTIAMRDDGLEGDAFGGDGFFSAQVPPQTNNAIVEFFVTARDSGGRSRSWPAPSILSVDAIGPDGHAANALYQVDDSLYELREPFYKIILTEAERLELQNIGNNVSGAANSDAQMNATFISIDGTGTEVRYLAGVRNRGHGTRAAKPNNFRVNFRSDDKWKGVLALNLNAQFSWLQVLGSAVNLKSGIAGAYSRAVQLRVNNQNLTFTGGLERTYGIYAANEAVDSDWADRHFPDDGEGNVYRAIRDLVPSNFDYRTIEAYPTLFGPEEKNSYTNTWFKSSNASEDDWTDLIGMLRVFGVNGTTPFTRENLEPVINIDQWLRHLAVMNLLGNSETGLNSGYNDDYFMYRGVNDPRFVLMYYDLDQILGFNGSFGTAAPLFSATNSGPSQGSGLAFNRFLRHPEFEPIYYAHLKELIETSLSAAEFDPLVDSILSDFVPETVRTQLKNWMAGRRNYVLSQLPAGTGNPASVAILSGVPRSPTPSNSAVVVVGGTGVTHYRYKLNDDAFSAEAAITVPITLNNLGNGTNTVAVIGRNAAGITQSSRDVTTVSWIVNTAWLPLRINEVLASRSGNQPDFVELYNEGNAPVNLAGLRLTDDPAQPGKFSFGSEMLAAGAFRVVSADELGFGLSAEGESVYLFNSPASAEPLDSVSFGAQLVDLSIGRIEADGDWKLTRPTPNAANVPEPVGSPVSVKINEWSATGISPFPDDFVELFNPASLPVAIGGLFLTDEPLGAPDEFQIVRNTFIPARGYLAFTTGNGNRADEITFGLAGEQGQVALLAPDRKLIDHVVYGPQLTGVSSGRCPDGADAIKRLEAPTPAAANQCPFVPPPPQIVPLISYVDSWRYNASGADLGNVWKETSYDDATWSLGFGLLGFETDLLLEPIRTPLENNGAVTFYFRKTFGVDAGLASAAAFELTHMVDDGAAFYLNGVEIGRYNLPLNAGSLTPALSNSEASVRVFPVPPNALRAGDNVLAVEVHQVNRTSTDFVFGMRLDALVITNSAAEAGVLINEVLADNASIEEADGSKPDWIEIYNPSTNSVDLAGMTLSDSLTEPTRWIFPSGSIVPGGGFLKVRFDSEAPLSSTKPGFSLKANGGSVYLFRRTADGGAVQSSVTYGLQPADWSIGRVPDGAANWTLGQPTLGVANIAATLGDQRSLRVNEWMAQPASGEDWFELFNPNPEPVELSGLALSDSSSSPLRHIIPPLSFIGNGARAFQKFEADDLVSAGVDHVNFRLGASGEQITLSFGNGALIDGISFGPQVEGVSQGRLLDGAANIVNFPQSPSPGRSNFLPLEEVVINEVLTHSDPPLEDAVELFNPTTSAVDISGWFLSDSSFNLRQFQVPEGTVIAPGGYLVFYEYQFNSDFSRFSFSSANGDDVYLSEASDGVLNGYRAAATFGAAENGISFGRIQTSHGFDFGPLARRTFGQDAPATVEQFRLGRGGPNSLAKIGPVVISEIMYHPVNSEETLEFVELHNITAETVPLFDPANPANTWRLRGGIDFNVPRGTSITPGGYIVLASFNPLTDPLSLARFRNVYGSTVTPVGAFTGRLDNNGEAIRLERPDAPGLNGVVTDILVDQVAYSVNPPWPATADGTGQSIQRTAPNSYGNEPLNWAPAQPTPGRPDESSRDSDLDGMPDGFETTHGFNPDNHQDADMDADADGLTNLKEFLAGTNPRAATDVLRIESVTVFGEAIALRFRTVAGRTYSILYSDTVNAAQWQLLATLSAAVTGPQDVLDAMPSARARFYKVISAARE